MGGDDGSRYGAAVRLSVWNVESSWSNITFSSASALGSSRDPPMLAWNASERTFCIRPSRTSLATWVARW